MDQAVKRHNGLTQTVLKAMSIFGGVQVLQIICAVVRTKLVAIWVGATGVGLFGIYNQALFMLNSVSQLSVKNSAVRNVASATPDELPELASTIRRWCWWLGIAGALLTVAVAPLLSLMSFGDYSHSWAFAALSVAVLLGCLMSGEDAILQGLRRYKRIARQTTIALIGGLGAAVVLCYYLRLASILPIIISYVVITAVALWFFRERVARPTRKMSLKQTFMAGRSFIVLGLYLTVSMFVTYLSNYSFMAYLNLNADTATVGLYNAGFTLVNTYVGMVFTAIGIEYYPRLAAAIASRRRTEVFVSHEMGLTLSILLPIVVVFITSGQLIVKILYNDEFFPVIPFITWAIVGTLLRAVSWCMAFVILAKGDGRVYLLTETLSAAVCFGLNVAFFHLWGIEGLGAAYIIWYGVYTVVVGAFYLRRYRLRLDRRVARLGVLTFIAAAVTAFLCWQWGWLAALPAALVFSVPCLVHLKRML